MNLISAGHYSLTSINNRYRPFNVQSIKLRSTLKCPGDTGHSFYEAMNLSRETESRDLRFFSLCDL